MAAGNIQRSRLIGDKLGVLWTPDNYNPASVTGYSTGTDQLTSHLKGIDTKLGSVASVVSATVTAAETAAQYDAVYIDVSEGKIRKSSNIQSLEVANFFGLVTESGGITTGNPGVVTINGLVTNGSWTWTPFLWVYVGSVPGTLTQTVPIGDGQYVVPVGVALSATSIQVTPQTGWVVSAETPSSGVGKLAFTQATSSSTIMIPSPNATITQVVVVVSVAAGGAGATLSIGIPGDTDRDLSTTYVDLMTVGIYVYDPYTDCGAVPDAEMLTIVAGGQTFSGTVYVFYSVPEQLTGRSGMAKLSFTQATSSPHTLLYPPDGSIISKIICVVDTAASGGSPTLSVGTVGDTDRDFEVTDSDLKVAGIYLYEPYTECGSNSLPIIVTLVASGQTFAGRAYLWYILPD